MTKVAVVAVHGVADQKPADSARSIADLLCADGSFTAFTEVPVRVARRRMDPGPKAHDDHGMQYMKEQLDGYPGGGTGAVYDTVRLEGKSAASEVHVHEVYWADLSRAGNTSLRLLTEFYQLILHLPSLGRNGLKYAAKEQGGGLWKAAHTLQRIGVWLLTVPALLINLVMLSAALIALSGEVPERGQQAVAFLVATALIAGIPLVALRALKARKLLWNLWIPILAAAGVAAWQLISRFKIYELLALEAAVIGALACFAISVAYTNMKRNAWVYGAIAAGAMLVIAIGFIRNYVTNKATAYVAALQTVERIYPAIALTWALIFAVAIVAAIAGVLAFLTTKRGQRMSAYRATWTARFSLGMPAALFAIVTLSIWYLVVTAIGKMAVKAGVTETFAGRMRALLFDSTLGFEYFIYAFAAFLAAALYAAAPSIAVEIKHPSQSTNDESRDLGRWLTRGILFVAAAAEAFTLAMAALFAIAIFKRLGMNQLVERLSMSENSVMPLLAATAGGLAVLLTAKRFMKTFRAAVDAMLDIDNYLRESPRNATPRARIAERFVSLMRHLCTWRDENGNPYDRIVIIAHSQGTVISADCLRYLNRVPDAALQPIHDGRIPLRLFTMGSPLRQLYAKAFPYLYSWIKDEPLSETLVSPDPATLTLQQWANVYRSGDYVGRNLWVVEEGRLWTRANPVPVSNEPVVDFCAGVGAHTHYWNHHGADVAAYLKSLV